MRSYRKLCDDTERATTPASKSEEEVLVLVSVSSHVAAIRKNHFQLLSIISAEAEFIGEYTVAASRDPAASSTDSSRSPTSYTDIVLVGKCIKFLELHASAHGNHIANRRRGSFGDKVLLKFQILEVVRPIEFRELGIQKHWTESETTKVKK